MPDEVIIRNCSPTLAGLKTANLFSVKYNSKKELNRDIRRLNNTLAYKGLRVLPFKYGKSKALIYMYRPDKLKRDLENQGAKEILNERGYQKDSPDKCIVTLINRIRTEEEFPHEIGLFLGYPPEDVRGFIENKADNYKMIGTWKVYGDKENAIKTFNTYKKCTNCYYKQWCKGKSIERLTVGV